VRSALSQNEDEDIDDEMLVMPIGMEYSNGGTGQNGNGGAGPPSAWGAAGAGNGSNSTFRPRHRSNVSGAASTTGYGARSVMSNGGGVYGSTRTKSLVSVEKGSGVAGTGTVGRKGSIAVGRGTTRKASGAAVEAVGITASGFFSAPVNSTGRSPGP
jgi:Rho GTPase-activating protein 1